MQTNQTFKHLEIPGMFLSAGPPGPSKKPEGSRISWFSNIQTKSRSKKRFHLLVKIDLRISLGCQTHWHLALASLWDAPIPVPHDRWSRHPASRPIEVKIFFENPSKGTSNLKNTMYHPTNLKKTLEVLLTYLHFSTTNTFAQNFERFHAMLRFIAVRRTWTPHHFGADHFWSGSFPACSIRWHICPRARQKNWFLVSKSINFTK